MKRINQANQLLLKKLNLAQKGVSACSRRGLTIIDFRIAGGAPTLTVEHNKLTHRWLEKGKAVVYVHRNQPNDQMMLTAQRMLFGCRIIFSYPRPTLH